MSARTAVVVDFDGTATHRDVGGRLLRHFARDDSWQVIDNDYENGRVGSRAAYRILERVLTGDPVAWLRFAEDVAELDPGLPGLVRLCRGREWHLEILSDGLDLYIGPLLARAGLDLPFRANHILTSGGRTRIVTPHMNPLCGRCGTCKTERLAELESRKHHLVYVGDGYSDLCAAPRAHRLFAKDVLARHCRERGIRHEPFATLADVSRALATCRPGFTSPARTRDARAGRWESRTGSKGT